MTELATYEPQGVVALNDPTGGRLIAWAQAAAAANQLAKALVQTTFVPAAFKGNVGDATAVILMGDELGLSPLAALRSIYSVHGTPAMYARTMVALAQSHGHEVWTEASSPAAVTVCGRRKGSDRIERAPWTIARAQKAGYTTNKKYQSNPEEMLYSKGAGEVCRKIAADVLAGIPYSVEDLELEQPEPTTTVTRAAATGMTRAQRAKPAAPTPEEPAFEDPETPSEPEPESVPESAFDPAPAATVRPDGDDITAPQMKMLHALFNDVGITEREDRLAHCAQIIGRTVESSKELSKDEASQVIDNLAALSEPDPS